MSNDFFNHTSLLTKLSLASSTAVNNLFAAVAAGFEKLPSKLALERNKVTYAVDSGSADTVEIALTPTLLAYEEGMKVRVKIAADNTGAATLNIDGLGAIAIKRLDGTDIEAPDLMAGDIAEFIYDGTNFMLSTPARSVQQLLAVGSGVVDDISMGFGQVNPPSGQGGAFAVNAALDKDSQIQFKADNVKRWEITRQNDAPGRLTTEAYDASGVFIRTVLDLRDDGRVLNKDAKNIAAAYIGAAWAGVTGSRTVGTTYQNTTGYPLPVHCYGISNDGSTKFLQVSTDGSTWVSVGVFRPSTEMAINAYTVVPAGHYYRVTSGTTIYSWVEGAV